MNCYEVLGIEETYEIKRIKKAYAAKSREYHPEDHPEEFQVLHAAYEEALGRAKWMKAKAEMDAEKEDGGAEQEVSEVTSGENAAEEVGREPEPEEENAYGQWEEQFEQIADAGGRNAGINWMVRRLMEEFHILYMNETLRSKLYKWRDFFDEPFDNPRMPEVFASREFVEAWYHFLGSHHIFTTQIWQYFASVDGYRFNSEQYGIPRFPYHLYIEQVQSMERAIGWEREDAECPDAGSARYDGQSASQTENNPPIHSVNGWTEQNRRRTDEQEAGNAEETREERNAYRFVKKSGRRKLPKPLKVALYLLTCILGTVGGTILGLILGLIFG